MGDLERDAQWLLSFVQMELFLCSLIWDRRSVPFFFKIEGFKILSPFAVLGLEWGVASPPEDFFLAASFSFFRASCFLFVFLGRVDLADARIDGVA